MSRLSSCAEDDADGDAPRSLSFHRVNPSTSFCFCFSRSSLPLFQIVIVHNFFFSPPPSSSSSTMPLHHTSLHSFDLTHLLSFSFPCFRFLFLVHTSLLRLCALTTFPLSFSRLAYRSSHYYPPSPPPITSGVTSVRLSSFLPSWCPQGSLMPLSRSSDIVSRPSSSGYIVSSTCHPSHT